MRVYPPRRAKNRGAISSNSFNTAPRYLPRVKAGKADGYTRIIKIGPRRGDNAPVAILELIPLEGDSA